jgi:citrate lyase subunit beta/citryl-CoA lyase
VVTEFNDTDAIRAAARRAAREFGCTRMWSIHPAQIRPIIETFAPDEGQIDAAAEILLAAARADWAPISVRGVLHDRASYRHYWQTLQRAHATGRAVPEGVAVWLY